jgi:hypothetical protein
LVAPECGPKADRTRAAGGNAQRAPPLKDHSLHSWVWVKFVEPTAQATHGPSVKTQILMLKKTICNAACASHHSSRSILRHHAPSIRTSTARRRKSLKNILEGLPHRRFQVNFPHDPVQSMIQVGPGVNMSQEITHII